MLVECFFEQNESDDSDEDGNIAFGLIYRCSSTFRRQTVGATVFRHQHEERCKESELEAGE